MVSEVRTRRTRATAIDIARLEHARAGNLRQLLLKASRSINQDVTAALLATGFANLKNSHVFCLANIDLVGTNIVDLASRSSVSKQAASKLVSELIELGYLSASASPSDGRAILVEFTKRGQALMEQSFQLFPDIESHYRRKVGAQNYRMLKRALLVLDS